MSGMRFWKWHALGNAYLIVEQPDAGALSSVRVRRLCDADTGIGSDGVLELVAHGEWGGEVVIWNPDGSVAEMSGNGVRIAARWLAERHRVDNLVVTSAGRTVAARMLGGRQAELELGPVLVGDDETVDVDGEPVELVRASVGNPHAVVRHPAPTLADLRRLGPALEHHPAFPGRTNVQLVATATEHVLDVLVWERGAGETAASGSSATAAAAVAVARGWCRSPVTVRMPGGELTVEVAGGRATLSGPAEEICSGETAL
ncbi:MAG: diaminopimelate epimerase [Gaiella sp.]